MIRLLCAMLRHRTQRRTYYYAPITFYVDACACGLVGYAHLQLDDQPWKVADYAQRYIL